MSTRSVSVSSENIGRIPVCLGTDDNNFTTVKIGNTEFSLWQLYLDNNTIAFEEHVMWDDFSNVVELLLKMFPDKVFELYSYCHDGYGYSCKCTMHEGKEVEWDVSRFSVYDDIEEYEETEDKNNG